MEEIKNLSLEYIAGLLDGEGCITIEKSKRKGKRNFSFDLRVTIVNKCKKVLELIHQQFNGSLIPRNHTKPQHSICWTWTITSNKAKEFLNLILPFMVIKKEEAKVAIEFQNYQLNSGIVTHMSNEKRIERIEHKLKLYKLLSSLKGKAGRVISPATTKRDDSMYYTEAIV